MGLRAKVVLMLLAMVLPMVSGFTAYRYVAEGQNMQQNRAERALERMSDRADGVCRGRRPPKRRGRPKTSFAVYDEMFGVVADPGGVGIPAGARAALEAAEDGLIVHERIMFDGRALGWSGARLVGERRSCYVVVEWTKSRTANAGLVGRVATQAVVLLLALLLTGLLISVPIVWRVRRLTTAVEKAPGSDWVIHDERLLGSKDELGELARAFDATGRRVATTIDELEQRDKALKEYISNTTHDLAIPLTVLQHRLKKIQELSGRGEVISAELVDVALEESHYIASLISNMSAAAKLDAGRTHQLEHGVELGALIERVIARHEPIARPKGVELGWSAPEEFEVRGDSVLLEQAVSNLVQNAIQYNSKGGHVAVLLEPAGDGEFELRVMDDGPGVPEHMLGGLAEREVRADQARNRNPGGQGFGLSITTRVCTLHGFDLILTNGEGGGFVATIRGVRGLDG